MTTIVNGMPLDEYLDQVKSQEVFQTGQVLRAKPKSLSREGNPLVEIVDSEGKRHMARVARSTNPHFGKGSNVVRDKLWRTLKEQNPPYDDLYVKVVGTPERTGGIYRVVCYANNSEADPTNTFTTRDAHEILVSNYIFYAHCIERKEKRETFLGEEWLTLSHFVECFDKSQRKLVGFLKSVSDRSRPYWEPSWKIGDKIWPETKISPDYLEGSEKFSFPGIQTDDRIMVRLVADNSDKGKDKITYFFEPVISIRRCDEAIDTYENRQLETRVCDKNGEPKERDYSRGDIVQDLPILTTFETRKFGLVGVGYLPRDRKEFDGLGFWDDKPFQYKKVWVMGADDNVGQYVRTAELKFDKGIILAKKTR